MKLKHIYTAALLTGAMLVQGCEEEFEQSAVAFVQSNLPTLTEGSSQTARIDLRFSRPLDEAAIVTIRISSETAIAGTHYETSAPSFAPGQITINAAAGTSTASFNVKSLNDNDFTNGHALMFEIVEVSGGARSIAQAKGYLNIQDNDPPATLASFDFEDCTERFAIPAGFTEERVPGFKADRGWGCQSFGFNETQGVQASGFGGSAGSVNTYLILDLSTVNGVDTKTMKSAYVGFMVESFFNGGGTIYLKYSTDYSGSGNPETASWTDIDISQLLPPVGSGQANAPDGLWKEVFVDASGIAGKDKVYLAFQFKGATNSSSSSWTIDDLKIYGK